MSLLRRSCVGSAKRGTGMPAAAIDRHVSHLSLATCRAAGGAMTIGSRSLRISESRTAKTTSSSVTVGISKVIRSFCAMWTRESKNVGSTAAGTLLICGPESALGSMSTPTTSRPRSRS
jgi:hypothetical protein